MSSDSQSSRRRASVPPELADRRRRYLTNALDKVKARANEAAGSESEVIAELEDLTAELRAQGMLSQAEEAARLRLAVLEAIPRPSPIQIPRTLNDLALIQKDQGDHRAARASMERAIEIEKRHFPEGHPTFATSYSNLATIQQDQGDLPAARASMERAIEIQKRHFPEGHPTFATSYSNLAAIQRAEGDYAAARASMERAIEIERNHFPEGHPNFAASYNNLAYIRLAEGDRAAACGLWRQALSILLKHFGEDHPHVQIVRESMRDAGCDDPPP